MTRREIIERTLERVRLASVVSVLSYAEAIEAARFLPEGWLDPIDFVRI